MRKYNLEERIKIFYTTYGPIGRSVLDIRMDEIKQAEEVIEVYERDDLFEPEIFRMPVTILESIYDMMDGQFRDFYDEIVKTNSGRKDLLLYHHEAVDILTKEIIKKKRQYYKSKGKYYEKRKNKR